MILGEVFHIAFLLAFAVLFVQSRVTLEFSDYENDLRVKHENVHLQKRSESQVLLVQRMRNRRSQNLNSSARQGSIPASFRGPNLECTGNKTVFEHVTEFNCYYDNACFEIFHDCCPDYEKHCGKQIRPVVEIRKPKSPSAWTCVKLGLQDGYCSLHGPVGVWMIKTCPTIWPSDETKTKCQNPPEKFSYPVEDYLPVVGENQFTYRNKHCAVCNGIHNYSTWNIMVETFVIPPPKYDWEAKLRFIVENGGIIEYVGPTWYQPRRYCAGENYIAGCDVLTHVAHTSCLNGPVEVVVTSGLAYYKNKACAFCNGESAKFGHKRSLEICLDFSPLAFSIVFNIRNPGLPPTNSVVSNFCPDGTVYDKILEFCRKGGYVTSVEDNLSNEFLIIMWFEMSSIAPKIFQLHFRTALTENFYLMPEQISSINLHQQDRAGDYVAATFRLTLTPYQRDLILANNNVTNMNISKKSKEFLKLLSFTEKFAFYAGKYRFAVIKLISKQLACFEGKILQPDEYQVDKENGKLFENKTGKYFLLKDYSILDGGGGGITLCRKLVLSGCNDGAFVPLHQNEFVILSNLSLYYNATNQTFEFGEYQIIEAGLDVNNNFSNKFDTENITNRTGHDRHSHGIFPKNTTFAICLPNRRTYNRSQQNTEQPLTNYSLRILTLVGFSISVIWLLLLLFTYGLFKKLRTLPGMNLMNLSISLLVSHLVWLIGTAYSVQMTTLCTVFAIIEHYLFLVSFVAMSVISYHSSRVFSQPFAIPNTSKGQRTFIKYSAIVWSCPAIFVTICVILDKTGIFTIDYGTNCWLGTKYAKIYLFLLPSAMLLFFNVLTFIRTAISLSRHKRQSQVLQQKKRKENLLICTKLATIVGFPWIFAFFGALSPDVLAFEYLFVIFVCLQGLYIGVAFLCNKTILKLYKNRWNQRRKLNVGSATPGENLPQTFELSQKQRSAQAS